MAKPISNLIAATIIAKFDDVKMIIIADNALFCNNAAVHLWLLLEAITRKTGQVAVFYLSHSHRGKICNIIKNNMRCFVGGAKKNVT